MKVIMLLVMLVYSLIDSEKEIPVEASMPAISRALPSYAMGTPTTPTAPRSVNSREQRMTTTRHRHKSTGVPRITESGSPMVTGSDFPMVTGSDSTMVNKSGSPVVDKSSSPSLTTSNLPKVKKSGSPMVTNANTAAVNKVLASTAASTNKIHTKQKGLPNVQAAFTPETPYLNSNVSFTSTRQANLSLKLEQFSPNSSMLYSQKELILLNVTVNIPFCAAPRDGLTYDVVLVTCYCDDLCDVFGDCCWPYDRFCNETKITGIELHKNDTERWLQGSREIEDVYSKYYWVVSSCPSNWHDEEVRNKCEFKDWSNDIAIVLPVSSEESNVTFKNSFCATCHNVTAHKAWKPRIVCHESQIEVFKDATTVAGVLEKIHLTPDCMLFFGAPDQHPGRPCIGPEWGHEPKSGTNNGRCQFTYDTESVRLCYSGPVSVTYFAGPRGHSYGRNVFCWLCHVPPNTTPSIQRCDENAAEIASKAFEPQGLSALIDYQWDAQCKERWDQDVCKQTKVCQEDEKWCSLPLDFIMNLKFNLSLKLSPKQPVKNPCELTALCLVEFTIFGGKDLSHFSPRGAWTTKTEGGFRAGWCSLPFGERDNLTVTVPITLKQSVRRVRDANQLFENFLDQVEAHINKSYRQIPHKGIDFEVSVVRDRSSSGEIPFRRDISEHPEYLLFLQPNTM